MPSKSIKIEPVNDSNIEEIKKVILSSSNVTEFAKKALVLMLEKSKNLTKQVRLCFPERYNKLGREVAYSIHDASNEINNLLRKIGTSMHYSSHGGHYVHSKFNTRTGGFTAWLALEYYSDGAEKLLLNIAEIKAMRLE